MRRPDGTRQAHATHMVVVEQILCQRLSPDWQQG